MIAKLNGVLEFKATGEVIVDCGGVGYGAAVSLSTLSRLPAVGEQVELWIVTNLRDNALELFGFGDVDERTAFAALRTVSGVGPRLALAILSGIEPSELAGVVADGDTARLTAISGVGRKTAERLLVDLRDKLPAAVAQPQSAASALENDAVKALVGLGYKHRKAVAAVQGSLLEGDDGIESLIRRALKKVSL